MINKCFEIPAAGCLLLLYDEHIKDPLKKIGFIDGINYISCNKVNLLEKIDFICNEKNIKIITDIRKKGQKLVYERHTLTKRYEQLYNLCKGSK